MPTPVSPPGERYREGAFPFQITKTEQLLIPHNLVRKAHHRYNPHSRGVAQLVARVVRDDEVAGSSPVTPTTQTPTSTDCPLASKCAQAHCEDFPGDSTFVECRAIRRPWPQHDPDLL